MEVEGKTVTVTSKELQEMDEKARQEELAAYAADPSIPMPVLIDLKASGIKLKWPYGVK